MVEDICQCHENLVKDIKEFLENVKYVKEESITDYLMWQWKKIDKRFHCVETETHSRYKEHHVSGADFDLELWILTNTKPVSFAVQAKKFIEKYNHYASSIRYPDNSKQQINKLLSYSKNNNKIPVYFLYSIPYKSKTKCKTHVVHSGVFVVSAHDMKKFSQLKARVALSLDTILNKSHSLSCYFCHEKSERNKFFDYLERDGKKDIDIFHEDQEIPYYVTYIMNGGVSNKNLPKNFRWVAVYDLRDKEECSQEKI